MRWYNIFMLATAMFGVSCGSYPNVSREIRNMIYVINDPYGLDRWHVWQAYQNSEALIQIEKRDSLDIEQKIDEVTDLSRREAFDINEEIEEVTDLWRRGTFDINEEIDGVVDLSSQTAVGIDENNNEAVDLFRRKAASTIHPS